MIRPIAGKKARKRPNGLRAIADGKFLSGRVVWRQRGIMAVGFLVIVAAITREPKREENLTADINKALSGQEIQAQFDFESVNIQATKEAQDAAAAKVPDYYRINQGTVEQQLQLLRERVEWIEAQRPQVDAAVFQALRESNSSDDLMDIVSQTVNTIAARLKDEAPWEPRPEASPLALWLSPDIDTLPSLQYADTPGDAPRPVVALEPDPPQSLQYTYGEVLRLLSYEGLEYVLAQGVRAANLLPGAGAQRIALLREKSDAEPAGPGELLLSELPSTESAGQELSKRLQETAKRAAIETAEPREWAKLHDAALEMVAPLLAETLSYDRVYTDSARQRAGEAVEPVKREILAGEIIQEQHKRWTPQSRADVQEYSRILQTEERPGQRIVATIAAHAIFVLLVMMCLNRSVNIRGWRATESARQYFNVALLIMGATLVVGRISSYFEPSGFVLPIAAAGILYAILVGVRLAGMVSFLTALLVSVQYGYDWRLLLLGTAMSFAGVFSIFRVRRRSDMAAASIKATLVGLLTIVAISLATDSLLSDASLRRFMLIALNGGICLLAVPGVLSPLERLFNITTDIQLLEYSDLNNELLSQLALKAPGTYAHSLMLGQLAEAAADAIGANGLLARVCAYYHDIGKMRRSEYFTENQTGPNIHDALSPRLSARAIAAHVIQGAEMAREHRLPRPIIDGILEHHGTCLIGYFYQQALQNQKHGDVHEKDFRYPGPKPQRPETAILMICDASESGVRSIKNANEERVREFIEGIVAARSADGQFDECDLTLKQLHTITEVVAHRILGSMHTRISYAPPKKEEAEDNIIPLAGGTVQ